MTEKVTEKKTKRVKPPEFTLPALGGSYVDGVRVAHTEPAKRHEKVEETDSADTN